MRSIDPHRALVALAAASAGWTVLFLSAPVLPAWLGAAVYAVGGKICHQLPERSFHWHGHQLAVCARCSGIYAVVPAVLAWLASSAGSTGPETREPLTPREALTWLGVGAMPTALTVVAETLGVAAPGNLMRAVAGLALGAAGAFVVGRAVTLTWRASNVSTMPR